MKAGRPVRKLLQGSRQQVAGSDQAAGGEGESGEKGLDLEYFFGHKPTGHVDGRNWRGGVESITTSFWLELAVNRNANN